MKTTWTKPYYGVTHAGTYGTQNHWVTVCDYGTFAVLTCWFPGCGFNPKHSDHASAKEAKTAGEKHLLQHA